MNDLLLLQVPGGGIAAVSRSFFPSSARTRHSRPLDGGVLRAADPKWIALMNESAVNNLGASYFR